MVSRSGARLRDFLLPAEFSFNVQNISFRKILEGIPLTVVLLNGREHCARINAVTREVDFKCPVRRTNRDC